MNNDFKKFSLKLLEDFPLRSKEVVLRRFGLNPSQKAETLESIGRDYKITRERVRQIENDSLKRLKEKISKPKFKSEFEELESGISAVLSKNGNVKKERSLLSDLGGKEGKNFVNFILCLSPLFQRFEEGENCYAVWALDKETVESAKSLCFNFEKKFQEIGKTLTEQEVMAVYRKEFEPQNGELEKEAVFSYLEICCRLAKTVDQKWGLASWSEVNPKTIKDKIEMVLKREKRPLHFQDISSLIERLNGQLEKVKKISPHIQTVHNELIKNNNFVLVGRGIYALKEWGYEPGQVKDIILKVLSDSSQPLAKEEIIQAVSRQRAVKESTILSSLRNKNFFNKDESGRYQVREA
ncbi:MAG: sigma factor-like helix-turn-helix DNA-binding protein [Candidatus Pacebacteria bacterium]|nr:sigma factor-like helix-turn-helix DNA-binding protein [Candidatus Paceibacterota bacterium]